jgi:hypothetical protein
VASNLKLWGGQPLRKELEALSRCLASSVVGFLDPGHDGQTQFLADGPALPAQDILLEQREEGFHGGVDAPVVVNSRFRLFSGWP